MGQDLNLDLVYENTQEAIAERKAFLQRERIGICDIVVPLIAIK